MADQIDVSQVIVEVEYQDPPVIKVSQELLEVEYTEDTLTALILYSMSGQVEYDLVFAIAGGVALALTPSSSSSLLSAIEVNGAITITLTPSVFTRGDHERDGSVAISLTPSSSVLHYPVYKDSRSAVIALTPSSSVVYEQTFMDVGAVSLNLTPSYYGVGPMPAAGNAPLSLTPSSVSSMSVRVMTGSVSFAITFVSNVDDSGLIGVPVYELTAVGGFDLSSPAAGYSVTEPSTYVVRDDPDYTEGGLSFGGEESSVEFYTKDTYGIEGAGGFELASDFGNVEFSYPNIITASGGFKLSGDTVIVFTSEVKRYALEASGGFLLSGEKGYEVELPSTFALSATGGFRLASESTIAHSKPDTYDVVAKGGFTLAGDTALTFTDVLPLYALTATGGLTLNSDSAAEFIHPAILTIVAAGGWLLGSEPEADSYHTWSIIGDDFDTSLYSGWLFNSYAVLQGQQFAAGEDGIYLLGGTQDAGQAINPGIRIGPTNLGVHNQKRIRTVRINDEGATVRVASSGEQAYSSHDDYKAAMSHDVQGEEFIIDITGFDKVSHIEIVPLILPRR